MRLPHLGRASAAFGSCVCRIWVMRLPHFRKCVWRILGQGGVAVVQKPPTFWPSPTSTGSPSSTDPAVQQSLFNTHRQITPVIRADAVEEVPSLKVAVDRLQ